MPRAPVTDGDGNITSNSYNSSRQRTATQTTDPSTAILDKESFTLDSNGFQATQVIGVGATPETIGTTFDKRGHLAHQTNPEGDTASYAFSPEGDLVAMYDGRNVEATTFYNAAGELVTETGDANQTQTEPTTRTLDGAGNVLTSTDADGNVTSNTYDSDNRRTKTTTEDPGHTVFESMSWTYDNDDNVLTTTDGDGNVTGDSFDKASRVLSEVVKDSRKKRCQDPNPSNFPRIQ